MWLGWAVIATLVSRWLRIATALSEIVVGTIAQLYRRCAGVRAWPAIRRGAARLVVVRPPEFGDEIETRAVIENSRRHYEKGLGSLRERPAKQPVAIRSSLVVGYPARSLPARDALLR
jgi:hypothetical protein